jgi:hypothetical protein
MRLLLLLTVLYSPSLFAMCLDDMHCPDGATCMVAQGESRGQCMKSVINSNGSVGYIPVSSGYETMKVKESERRGYNPLKPVDLKCFYPGSTGCD